MHDICSTGVIISNYPQYSITLSKYSDNFTKISAHEDKCIIFTIPTTQEYVVSLNGVNSNVFIYTDNQAITSLTGTTFKQFKASAELTPIVIRFVSQYLESTSIKISMKSSGQDPSYAWTVFHDPNLTRHCYDEECTLFKALHMDIVLNNIFAFDM